MTKPSIPSGTRDFGPEEAARRIYIFRTLEKVFRLYGFKPLETPALENLETLTGKYGDEGEQLIFKVLNSGEFNKKIDPAVWQEGHPKVLGRLIADRALRYDLTVPFARHVVMNRHAINFPFRRYQIQPVWRADRPQKGRYREFYQCDVDIIGTNALEAEAELLLIYKRAFKALGIEHYQIRINHRKLLQGVAACIGAPDQFSALTVAIDKLDKIGREGVEKELRERVGFTDDQIIKLNHIFDAGSDISKLKLILQNEDAAQGLADLELLLGPTKDMNVIVDVTLARGLTYYTGAIFEVIMTDPAGTFKGSISGGGRYDNLTGIFGMPGISGVGVSFGADRIFDVMNELQLFPDNIYRWSKVLICCMDDKALPNGRALAELIRDSGERCEIYPSADKLKKQLGYANDNRISFAVIIGTQETESGLYTLKNLETGEQWMMKPEEIVDKVTHS